MTEPSTGRTPLAERVYSLIFNGVTRAGSAPADADLWLPLSARERIAEAVYAELRAGNIEFRLGPLALLAEAVETEARLPAAQERITELARKAVDARLDLADAIRDACPKPHSFVQHRDHQPAWCNICGRGENGVRYDRARLAAETETP